MLIKKLIKKLINKLKDMYILIEGQDIKFPEFKEGDIVR